jgi:hypothetical protein
VLTLPALAQDASGQRSPAADFATLEAAQNAANGKAGPRTVPGRSIPVPATASKELQASIAAPYRVPNWNANPEERGGVEGADQQARICQRRGAARRAREARRDHGTHRDRRGEGFHPVAEGDPGGESKPAARTRARRRLRLQSG